MEIEVWWSCHWAISIVFLSWMEGKITECAPGAWNNYLDGGGLSHAFIFVWCFFSFCPPCRNICPIFVWGPQRRFYDWKRSDDIELERRMHVRVPLYDSLAHIQSASKDHQDVELKFEYSNIDWGGKNWVSDVLACGSFVLRMPSSRAKWSRLVNPGKVQVMHSWEDMQDVLYDL